MEHLAIDLGGKESQICVRSSDGQIVEERRCRTATLPAYLATRPGAASSSRPAAKRLGSRTPRWARARGARRAGDAGADLGRRCAPAEDRPARRSGAQRGVLPDRSSLGARAQSAGAGAQDDVWHAGSAGGRPDEVDQHRARLAASRGRRPRGGDAHHFAARRALCRGPLPTYVERQLRALDRSTRKSPTRTGTRSDREGRPIARRLMTVPGVGPPTALRFVAALDDIRRFRSAHPVESYLGLVPGENSSSERQHRSSITKAGRPRFAGARAGRVGGAPRGGRDPMQLWAERSRSDAGNASRSWRSRESSREFCTPSGETAPSTSRADQARSDRVDCRRVVGATAVQRR